MKTRIERQWPVAAAAPAWVSKAGASLGAELKFSICMQRDMGRLPHAAALDAGADASDVVGAIEFTESNPLPAAILMTQASLTALFSELGLECATLRALDHLVCNLVEDGHVEPEREMREWSGLGQVVVYRVRSAILGVWD